MAEGLSIGHTISFSKVYSEFCRDFLQLKADHSMVNKMTKPTDGTTSEKKDVTSEKNAQHAIYGGFYLRAFIKWEAFVQDFLEETYLETINREIYRLVNQGQQPSENGTKLLQNVFKDISLSCPTVQQPRDNTLEQILVDHVKVTKVFRDHIKHKIKGCGPTLDKIKGYLKTLLDINVDDVDLRNLLLNGSPTESLSKKNPPQFNYHCIIRKKKETDNFFVRINDPNGIQILVNLLYGVRCVLSHSNHRKTFEHGIFSEAEFKDKPLFLKKMGKSDLEATEELYSLYTRAKDVYTEKTSTFQIYYSDIVNIQRVITLLVSRFYNTIVRLVQKHYDLCLWEMIDPPYKRESDDTL